jgi:hypothetical protein
VRESRLNKAPVVQSGIPKISWSPSMPLSSYGFNFTAIHICLVAVASVEDNDCITMLNAAVLYVMQLETVYDGVTSNLFIGKAKEMRKAYSVVWDFETLWDLETLAVKLLHFLSDSLANFFVASTTSLTSFI